MKTATPATLELQQQKSLGFRILAVPQAGGAKDSHIIAAHVGSRAGSKIGSKEGMRCSTRSH
jgi:hypothetical protein